jgi:hypothetical protein
MRKNKKRNRVYLLLLILLGITIGYALISTTLKMVGSINLTKHTWKVYWDNPQVTEGSKSSIAPDIIDDDGQEDTKAVWSTTFDLPGEFYEFTIDAKNEGDWDVMVTDIISSVTPTLPSYISYTFSYADGQAIEQNHLLAKNTTESYKVRVEYLSEGVGADEINNVESDVTYNFAFGIVYGKATNDAVPRGGGSPAPGPVDLGIDVGDYISLTPTKTSYSVDVDVTGYSAEQTINPSELNLWRVIKENENGTLEAVSEYTSSVDVKFYGEVGYINLTGGLQKIASSYAKSGYTVGTRMMGYDTQPLSLPDWDFIDNNYYSNFPPSTSTSMPTTGTGTVTGDGHLGDTMYLKDYQLVNTAYGSSGLAAKKVGTNTNTSYWLSSRRYIYNANDDFRFGALYIDANGDLNDGNTGLIFVAKGSSRYSTPAITNFEMAYALRPIITLSNNVVVNGGTGTSADPYTFR